MWDYRKETDTRTRCYSNPNKGLIVHIKFYDREGMVSHAVAKFKHDHAIATHEIKKVEAMQQQVISQHFIMELGWSDYEHPCCLWRTYPYIRN